MARIIQWKRGTTAQNDEYTGKPREITVDTQKRTIRVHDGSKPGGHELLRLADVPAELSDLTNDIGAWEKDQLVNLSQLINDMGFISKTELSKLSDLVNDMGYKVGHCAHCTHCTYCQQCEQCHNCTTIDCTTIDCTTIQCVQCNLCSGTL